MVASCCIMHSAVNCRVCHYDGTYSLDIENPVHQRAISRYLARTREPGYQAEYYEPEKKRRNVRKPRQPPKSKNSLVDVTAWNGCQSQPSDEVPNGSWKLSPSLERSSDGQEVEIERPPRPTVLHMAPNGFPGGSSVQHLALTAPNGNPGLSAVQHLALTALNGNPGLSAVQHLALTAPNGIPGLSAVQHLALTAPNGNPGLSAVHHLAPTAPNGNPGLSAVQHLAPTAPNGSSGGSSVQHLASTAPDRSARTSSPRTASTAPDSSPTAPICQTYLTDPTYSFPRAVLQGTATFQPSSLPRSSVDCTAAPTNTRFIECKTVPTSNPPEKSLKRNRLGITMPVGSPGTLTASVNDSSAGCSDFTSVPAAGPVELAHLGLTKKPSLYVCEDGPMKYSELEEQARSTTVLPPPALQQPPPVTLVPRSMPPGTGSPILIPGAKGRILSPIEALLCFCRRCSEMFLREAEAIARSMTKTPRGNHSTVPPLRSPAAMNVAPPPSAQNGMPLVDTFTRPHPGILPGFLCFVKKPANPQIPLPILSDVNVDMREQRQRNGMIEMEHFQGEHQAAKPRGIPIVNTSVPGAHGDVTSLTNPITEVVKFPLSKLISSFHAAAAQWSRGHAAGIWSDVLAVLKDEADKKRGLTVYQNSSAQLPSGMDTAELNPSMDLSSALAKLQQHLPLPPFESIVGKCAGFKACWAGFYHGGVRYWVLSNNDPVRDLLIICDWLMHSRPEERLLLALPPLESYIDFEPIDVEADEKQETPEAENSPAQKPATNIRSSPPPETTPRIQQYRPNQERVFEPPPIRCSEIIIVCEGRGFQVTSSIVEASPVIKEFVESCCTWTNVNGLEYRIFEVLGLKCADMYELLRFLCSTNYNHSIMRTTRMQNLLDKLKIKYCQRATFVFPEVTYLQAR